MVHGGTSMLKWFIFEPSKHVVPEPSKPIPEKLPRSDLRTIHKSIYLCVVRKRWPASIARVSQGLCDYLHAYHKACATITSFARLSQGLCDYHMMQHILLFFFSSPIEARAAASNTCKKCWSR